MFSFVCVCVCCMCVYTLYSYMLRPEVNIEHHPNFLPYFFETEFLPETRVYSWLASHASLRIFPSLLSVLGSRDMQKVHMFTHDPDSVPHVNTQQVVCPLTRLHSPYTCFWDWQENPSNLLTSGCRRSWATLTSTTQSQNWRGKARQNGIRQRMGDSYTRGVKCEYLSMFPDELRS